MGDKQSQNTFGWASKIYLSISLPREVVANMLIFDIVVNKFELWLHYYVQFKTNNLGKGMNSLISPAEG